MEALQDTAKSISQAGGYLGKTHLKEFKIHSWQCEEWGVKSPVKTNVRAWAGGAPGSRAQIPQQPEEKTHHGAGEECEEEGVAERSCHWLTIIPHPQPSLHLFGGGCRGYWNWEWRCEVEPGKGEREEGVLIFLFLTTQLYFNLQKIKLIFPNLSLSCLWK